MILESTTGYKTLSYAINKVKIDFDILGTNMDIKLRNHAVDTFIDMNMYNTLPTMKTAFLKVDHNGVANFPDDYEKYYKIGIHHCGRILNLTANDEIALVDQCCGHDEFQGCLDYIGNAQLAGSYGVTSPESNWQAAGFANWDTLGQGWDYLPGFHNGQYVAGYYGRGANVYRGGYKIDEENRNIRLHFRGCHDKEIIMEYKSSGGIETGDAYLPTMAGQACIYGIKRRLCENSIKKEWVTKTDMWTRRYNNSLKRLVWINRGFTATEALQVIRESFHQTPKR